MKTINELLRDADPVQQATIPPDQREVRRQAVLAAASSPRVPAGVGSRSRIATFVIIAVVVMAASFLRSRMSPLVSEVQAAVRFEVKLAEDKPAPGLPEVRVSGANRVIYLHNEVIVDNRDIAAARVVEGDGPARFSVSVEFNSSGSKKMRAATANHVGRPVAIILDGEVVRAPAVRAAIGGAAMLTGDFTRAQAERIVNGIH